MANKRTIDVPIVGGLNQKEAVKNLVPPNLLTLENGIYNKNGRIDKAKGYTNIGQTINTGTLTTPRAVEHLNDELVMISQDRVYSYSDSDSTWYDRGEIGIVNTQLEPTNIQSSVTMSSFDTMHKDNIQVATWTESGKHYYSIYDKVTSTFIVRRNEFSADSGTRHCLASLDSNIYLTFSEGTDLKVIRIPTANPVAGVTTVIIANDIDSATNGLFDIVGHSDGFLYVMYKETGATNLKLIKLTNTLTSSTTRTIASQSPDKSKSLAIAVFNSTSYGADIVCLGWSDSNTHLKGAILQTDFTDIVAAKNLQANTAVGRITILPDSTDTSTVGFYYGDEDIASSQVVSTRVRSVTVADGSTTITTILNNVLPMSRGFIRNGVRYLMVFHESTLQSTYFLINTESKIVGKFAAGQGPGDADLDKPVNISAVDSTDYLIGILKKTRIQSIDQTLTANLGTFFGEISFDPINGPITTEINGTLLIAGSIIRAYDGVSATEYGFHLFPEGDTATAVAGAGIPDGTYLVQHIYEWTDAKSNRYRSAPSIAQSVTTSGGNNRIEATVPILRLTDKTDIYANLTDRQPIVIKTYITEASGTIPYLAATTTATNTANATITLSTDPATLTSNEFLYTSGGALENIAPEPCNFILTHNNRIVTMGLENKNQIQISKDIRASAMPGFNEDLTLTFDPAGGNIIGGASMDNNLVIQKRTATYSLAGDPPNDLGAGSTFGTPQLISSDIGCSEPKSIFQLPDGIIFRSTKGIYLLNRGLTLSYIGAPVEDDVTGKSILSTDILTDNNEIRFATNNNKILVYNYYFKRWSTISAFGILDATIWKNDTYVYLTSAKVLTESASTYLNDGDFVTTTLRTGWIHLSGMQGFQRIQRLAMLGTYYTNNTFTVGVYKDYSEDIAESKTLNAGDIVNATFYGSSATYGAEPTYGGGTVDEVYQLRYHMQNQKSEAISIQISDATNGTNTGQSFSINGLALTVTGKGGIFRTSTGRSR